jgi:dihydrofolate reductase
MIVSLIVAMDKTGLIGTAQGLPWRLSRDLKRFRSLTWGKPIVMGRTTLEHIGGPLPGRHNLVLTRQPRWQHAGCVAVPSLSEALRHAREFLDREGGDEVVVIGGGQVYREALPLCDRIYLTIVEGDFEGDTFFPREMMQSMSWRETVSESWAADEKNPYPHCFRVLERDRP